MIFFDMDGVLCNFNKAAKGLIATAGKELPAENDWHYLSSPCYKEEVNIIATSPDFWLNLEEFKEAIEAFELVREQSLVLSSPGFPVSATPKLHWCKKHLGLKDNKVILTSAKHYLADYNRWLIDDKSSNCVDWVKAGGNAIMINHPYSLKDADYTLDDLMESGIEICKVTELPQVVGDLFGC